MSAARTPDSGHDAGDRALTAREAAARIGVNERTIRRAIGRGELPAVKQRGVFAIDGAALDAWRARRAAGAASPDRSGEAPRQEAGLPEPVTSLVGRERELATAIGMLRRDDVRLLTLTGAGGIGKTRLSLEIARQIRPDFAGNTHVVPLAEVPDASLVAAAIAGHLGLPEPGSVDARSALVAGLRDARLLLVLDNFEHVMGAAPLVSDLLRCCPRIKVLVTSRSLLRVGGEHALPVPPLALPDALTAPSVEQAAASPAVRLFTDRARSVAPRFSLTPASAPAVVAICQRLAGLPLAIELAASQVTVLPPDALLARIEARQPLPLGGPRDAPDRQRTMTGTIAWSYDLLAPDERRLFRRVGVFAGGFPLDAVHAVTGDACPGSDPLITLAALVDASLIQRVGDDGARYAMLEPVRAFALEQLAAAGELDAACDALVEWCLVHASSSPMAESLPGGERYLARLGTEYANIRRALEWLSRQGDAERLGRLVTALGGYWYERSHYHEGREWTERALALDDRAAPLRRGQVMVQLGLFHGLLGNPSQARQLAADGMALLRLDADAEVLALGLLRQGAIEMQNAAYEAAERALDEVLRLAEIIPDATLATTMAARAMSNLGAILHIRGDLDGAATWHEHALRSSRELGYLPGIARALCDLADIARDRGDHAASFTSYRQSLAVLGERSDLRAVADALVGVALAVASWNEHERAARLLGAAAGLAESLGIRIHLPTDRAAYDLAVRTVREALGERRFDRHVAAGHRLTVSEAIAEMLALSPPVEASPTREVPGSRLSPREREVLRLLADGLRDREIADALFISARTVEGHVTRILAKLDVPTRVAAARAAVDLGIAGPNR